jgi:hypothetical protein
MEPESRDANDCTVYPKRYSGADRKLIIATAAAITTAWPSSSTHWPYTVQFSDQHISAFCGHACIERYPHRFEGCVPYTRNRRHDALIAHSELCLVTPVAYCIKPHHRCSLWCYHIISQRSICLTNRIKSRHYHNPPPSLHRSMWLFSSDTCACRRLRSTCRSSGTANGHS